MPPVPEVAAAWVNIAEALLIGLLIGVQRETDRHEKHAGLRDFIVIGFAGGLCAFVQQVALTVAVLAGLTVLIAVFRWQHPERTGVTTELSAIATFLLAYVAGLHHHPHASPIAVGLAILLVFFLEAKQALDTFVTQTISPEEFNGTLRFLAVILVVYPILPDAAYGPYEFFNPQKIWLFIILVSSISYVGYFFQKFLGAERGLLYTSLLGGLASTTAATSAFAKDCAEDPERHNAYAFAAVLANSVQFPRLLILIVLISPALARAAAPMLLAMTAAGLVVAVLFRRFGAAGTAGPTKMQLRNPFRFLAALEFGLLFAFVRFLTRFATTEFGGQAIYGASFVGGAMDTDAVVLSLPGLIQNQTVTLSTAVAAILIAIAANALVKTGIAFGSRCLPFSRAVLIGFAAMIAAGALAVYGTARS
jgi:uncharacterized membrane protein (DUF4010 family)